MHPANSISRILSRCLIAAFYVIGANSIFPAGTARAQALSGTTANPNQSGVSGNNNSKSTSPGANGVYGSTSSPAGSGTVGVNFATGGGAYGVYGQSTNSTAGIGVVGVGTSIGVTGTGATGVTGTSTSATGAGVSGANTATTGSANGGYFATQSPAGSAVVGVAATPQSSAGFFQGNVLVTGNLGIGGDAPMSSNPHLVFSGFLAGNLGSNPLGGFFVPDHNIIITRISAAEGTIGNFCSTDARVLLNATPSISNQTTIFSLDLNVGFFNGFSGFPDSGPISLPVSAGTGLIILGQAASGCSTVPLGQSPSNVFVNVQYVMQ